MNKIKIIYIAGRGRSGSTLLEQKLAHHFNCFPVGEARLWPLQIKNNAGCSCGAELPKCKVWSNLTIKSSKISASTTYSLHDFIKLSKKTNYRWFFKKNRYILKREFNGEARRLFDFYTKVVEVVNYNCIIDSSKNPFYGLILSLNPNIEVCVIHLIRDPRAVWYSWKRQKNRSQDILLYSTRMNIIKSSFYWLFSNFFSEILGNSPNIKYTAIRYEDFVEYPDLFYQNKFKQFFSLNDAKLKDNKIGYHTISGNPIRMDKGKFEIKPDMEWKTNLSWFDYIIVTILTLPILRKYYPILLSKNHKR